MMENKKPFKKNNFNKNEEKTFQKKKVFKKPIQKKKHTHVTYAPDDIGGKMGYIEYKVPASLEQDYLRETNGKGDPQKYFRDLVNQQYGLKGYCVRVIFDL